MVPDRLTRRQLLATLAILAVGLVPDRIVGAGPARLRASLASGLFNRADAARIERGYYEQLLDDGQRFDDLGDLPALRGHRRPGGTFAAPVDSAPLVVRVDDLREVALRPSDSTERGGVRWITNAQGMRDREYPVDKPAGTFRIAMVGDSIAAGWGVNVDDRFESILERVWDDRSRRASGPAVEVLDCAVPGHAPGQRWHHFQRVGWPMRPDLVICEATEADIGWDERRLRYVLARGQGFDSPLYRWALDASGVAPGWSPDQYKHALQPYHREILAGAYRAMAADGAARGVPIVWVLIPRVGQPSVPAKHEAILAMARAAGFARVVDASDAYDGLDAARLAVEPDDFHPNPDGHARLAHRLDEALAALPEFRALRTPAPAHVDRAVQPGSAGPGPAGSDPCQAGKPGLRGPDPTRSDPRDPSTGGVPHR
jgi:lysophospholipase L1-like esterase